MNTKISDEIKQIVIDTYLSYDTSLSAAIVYDIYIRSGESDCVRRAFPIGKSSAESIQEEMQELYLAISELLNNAVLYPTYNTLLSLQK
mgnify:CR=1 FL=1